MPQSIGNVAAIKHLIPNPFTYFCETIIKN